MFTGIIESIGKIESIQNIKGDIRLVISSENLDFSDINLGDSIASNGVCLTVVELWHDRYAVDVSRETIQKTTLKDWKIGDIVNLEKAMLPTTRFGGHIVSGHIDDVGIIQVFTQDARSIYIEIKIPSELARYTATKGSITVDGISLTTNLVKNEIVCLNIIPHTAKMTNIASHWQVGTKVNIEVDIVSRYLERLLWTKERKQGSNNTLITEQFLAENGFLKE